MPPILPPVTANDAAIIAAINAVESSDSDIVDPAIAATWAAFQSGITSLCNIGDLSAATVSTISALTTKTVPMWDPPVTAGDIQTAMAQ